MNNRVPTTQITADKPLQIPEPFLSPALFQSLFWKPRFLVDTPLTEHLPLLFWLTSVIRPSQIGVVGADNGVAHFAFCQALDQLGIDGRCIGFGFWKNQNSGKRATTLPPRLKDHEDMLYDVRSQLTICEDGNEIFDLLKHKRLDVLFCDLTALPGEANISLDELIGHLSRSGMLILHGVNHSASLKAIANNISRFLESRGHVKFISGDGIAIFSNSDDLPPPLRSLFEAASEGILRTDVEQVFRRCGYGVRASAATKASVDARQRAEKAALEAQTLLESARSEIEVLQLSHQQRSNKLIDLQTEMFDLSADLEAARDAQAQSEAARAAQAKVNQSTLDKERKARFSETEALTRMLQEQRANLATLEVTNRQLKKRNEMLEGSTSWRITAPIRAVKKSISGKPK